MGPILPIGPLERRLSARFLSPILGVVATPADFQLEFEDAWIDVEVGVRLHGWLIRATNEVRPTIVVFHGARANVSYYFPHYRFLTAAGFHVFLVDYRGYGRSDGEVSVAAMLRDLKPTFDWLRRQPRVDANRMGVYGVSLGSVAALAAAAGDAEIAAVCVENCVSPRAEIAGALRENGHSRVFGALLGGLTRFFTLARGAETVRNARRVQCPLLVIQGEDDAPRFTETSRAVVANAAGPTTAWFVEGVGHAPGPLCYRAGTYRAKVTEFFQSAFLGELRESSIVDDRSLSDACDEEAEAHVLHDSVRERLTRARRDLDYADLADFMERVSVGRAWTARLGTELVDVMVEVADGIRAEDEQRSRSLLEQAVAAVPERPHLHWWGGNGDYHVGFPHAAEITRAIERLRPLYEGEWNDARVEALDEALARLAPRA